MEDCLHSHDFNLTVTYQYWPVIVPASFGNIGCKARIKGLVVSGLFINRLPFYTTPVLQRFVLSSFQFSSTKTSDA